MTAATTASTLPTVALVAAFAYLDPQSLWAASRACRGWREVADGANEACWRIAVFNTYYSGRTFEARLPAGGAWDDSAVDGSSSVKGWPTPGAKKGNGGALAPVPADGDDPAELEYLIEPAPKPRLSAGGVLPPLAVNQRRMINAVDFRNKDIRRFFAPFNLVSIVDALRQCRLANSEELFAQFHVLLKLAKAGKSGWKAFGLLLSTMFDPSGRLRVAAAAGDARRLNEVVDLMENGWRPLEGAMPWRHSQPCKFETLYLTPNIDLAPGLVLLNRDVMRAADEEGGTGDLLGFVSYLGPDLLDTLWYPIPFGVRTNWAGVPGLWGPFFRLMFLCNPGGTCVDFDSFQSDRIWDKFAKHRWRA